jgi:hypothetical protein
MRIKTILIIVVTILLTVVIMQNNEPVFFNILFATYHISKLAMLLFAAIAGFIIGVLVGRPGRPKYIPGQVEDADPRKSQSNTLSDEDRDYIN